MTDDLMLRLQNCYNLLEDEGYYTKANTVHLAMDRIKALEANLTKAVEHIRYAETHGDLADKACTNTGR